MTIVNFEYIMSLVEKGYSFQKIIDERILPKNHHLTFINFLIENYPNERSIRKSDKIRFIMDKFTKELTKNKT